MLTLKKLRGMVTVTKNEGRVPTVKQLQELEDTLVVKKKIDSETEISVYKNGFVHYRAGKNNTVFGIWNCDESYCYKSTKDFSTIIDSSYFDDAEWYIRLIIEGEDILERNQKRVRSNHKEFLFDDLGNEEDIFEEVNDFVDEISRKDFVMRMMDDLNEYQRTIIDLFYFRQWKQKEIAQYLGVSQQNVSSILSRSLKNLAEYAKKNKYF